VLVTTPQDVALADVRRGATMFNKVNVPVLGVIENMNVFVCPNCGHAHHIFGQMGARKLAAELGINLIGGYDNAACYFVKSFWIHISW
jgi:ATP-binding protein involved in chromosome partitioning